MKVTLIGGESADRAAAILIFTKSTRLQMSPGLFQEILQMPMEDKLKELEYMANTIPSSWEFVDYIFMIEGVTRAFTHQLVRTRTASFAQQTMRVLDVSQGPGWDYLTGPSITWHKKAYDDAMGCIDRTYKDLIADGVKVEDARGLLPTNILTNIVMKINLRNFTTLVRSRSSPRTQSEYRSVLDEMKSVVLQTHPWTELFFNRTFDKAAQDLDSEIKNLDVAEEQKMKMIKLVDQMRRG